MQPELHLRDIFRVIRKHRWTAVFFFLLAVTGTIVITLMTTPTYIARTKVIIDRTEPSDLTERSRSLYRDPEFFETQYQLIKSQAVAERVVDMMGEEDKRILFQLEAENAQSFSPIAWVKSIFERLAKTEEKSQDEQATVEEPAIETWLAKAISARIRVRPADNSRMVQISYESPDPRYASLVTNSVVEGYMQEINQMKQETSRHSIDWMNRKAEGEAAKLKEAEKKLQSYMGENEILSLENRIAVIPEKLSRISSELVSAETRRKEFAALVEQVRGSADDFEGAESVSAVLSDPALQSLRSQIVDAEKNILELSGKYGPRHPVMIKAKGDLEILKRKKNQEIARIRRSIQNEYELALAKERNLRAQMEESKIEAMRMNEKFLQYQALKAEVDTNRQLFDALKLKMKEEGITSESQSVRLWIVEKAGIPSIPSKPAKTKNMLMGMVLGILGGLGLVFFLEYFDNTIRNPDEAEITFQTPVLGTISLLRGRENIEKVVLEEPLSAQAESYKSLRTTLLTSGALPRRFLVTSSLAGEGKTSTAVNLALALAMAENRVLLIDGDMRKPRVHTILKLDHRNGLSNLISAPLDTKSVAKALQAGPLPNLSVLTSGSLPSNPSELLMSRRMKELLRFLEEKYDVIICDSPPVLAVEDSRILSQLFNGTILVTRAHHTTFEVAGRTLKLLRHVKAPVLGFVVNALDQRKSESYYHSKYYTSYQPDTLKLQG